jgi:hypothetical protein
MFAELRRLVRDSPLSSPASTATAQTRCAPSARPAALRPLRSSKRRRSRTCRRARSPAGVSISFCRLRSLRWKSRRSRSATPGISSNPRAANERPARSAAKTLEASPDPLAGSNCPRGPRSRPIPPYFPRWRRQCGAWTQPSDRRTRSRKRSASLPTSQSRPQALPALLILPG